MKLIVGLGNYGDKYEKTRHNAGFMAVEKLADKLNIEFNKNKFHAKIGEGFYEGEKIIIAQPQTYMNLSGVAVAEIMDFYKLEMDELLVIFDDMDMPLGKMRIRQKGSAGGHNGIKSIIGSLGNNQNFNRFKLGIGKPERGNVIDFVIGKMTATEMVEIAPTLDLSVDATLCWIKDGIDVTMNKYNTKK